MQVKNHIQFDQISYNNLIRNVLKINYLLRNHSDQISLKNYKDCLNGFNSLLSNFYEEIHKVTDFEKLIISIIMYINFKKKVSSTQTSKIMNDIFKKSTFKISDEVDKYVYMGLFNRYSSNLFRKVPLELNKI